MPTQTRQVVEMSKVDELKKCEEFLLTEFCLIHLKVAVLTLIQHMTDVQKLNFAITSSFIFFLRSHLFI